MADRDQPVPPPSRRSPRATSAAGDPARATDTPPIDSGGPVVLPPPPPVNEEPPAPPPPPIQPPGKPLRGGWLALDRAAVLLIGVAVGVMIGVAFLNQGGAPSKGPAGGQTNQASGPPITTITQDCPMPYGAHLMSVLSQNQTITVGVFGDSFGDGVWAALYHLLPKNYHVVQFSKESTGFTRYASLNLEDVERDQLAQGPVDIAVIDFGANDTQGIYDGGHAYALLSDGWRNVYGQRMDRYVTALRNQGAMVYWLGLPIMRKPEYDSQISGMLAFYDQRMTALGVPYIDVKKLSEDANGQFNDYLPVPGQAEPRLMRAQDGIHMSFAGYERIAQPVADRIQAYVQRARATLALDAPPPAAPAPAAASPAAPTPHHTATATHSWPHHT